MCVCVCVCVCVCPPLLTTVLDTHCVLFQSRLRWTCNEFAEGGEPCETPPEWVRKTVALAAVWFLATVQIISTSAATVVQGFFTVEKLVLVFTLCVLGVANAATPGGLARIPDQFGNTTDARGSLNLDRSFDGTSPNVANWALAVMNCLFAYNG